MHISFVDLQRQNKILKKELLSSIESVINAADFIMGKELTTFEADFARYCGKKYAVGVNSGTDALQLALVAYGIGPGDEVITVPNSYFSTAMVVSNIGAIPVFVDVDPQTSTIDVSKIETVITPKTKAIIPVHLYGQAADMKHIMAIAEKHKLVVIEDACQAHGAKYQGKKVPYSETGCFSFYPGKNLGCFGDGGAVVTDNAVIAEKLLYLRNDGAEKKYVHKAFGTKSRLDTLQAAILQIKLPHLDAWNALRRQHAARYTELLQTNSHLVLPTERDPDSHVFHLYVIECEDRDKLREYLSSHGIETGIHYPIPIHLQEAYMGKHFHTGMFPITEKKAQNILSLPMFPELTDEEITYVVEKIKSFYTKTA